MDIAAELKKIPPITRTLVFSLLGITGPLILNVSTGYWFVYWKDAVFRKMQLWRLYTSFFFGSTNINLIFEIAMLYRSANDLESGPYSNKSGDLAWQLFWAGLAIMGLSNPIGTTTFFRPLLHTLSYLSSSLSPPSSQSSLFGLLTVPTKYMPYIMLTLELLTGGPALLVHCIPGTIVGHLWWWSVWGGRGGGGVLTPWARAPRWVGRYFRDVRVPEGEGAGAGRGVNQGGGGGVHVIRPRQFAGSTAAGAGAGARGGGGGGYHWGSGNRLGGS